MLPSIQFFVISVGPIPVQVWGFFVASGILVGTIAGAWMAKRRGQDSKIIWDLAFWVTIGSVVFARLFHVLYEPALYFQNPMELVQIWHGGLSIMGGFFGALLFGVIYLRKKQVDVYAYADSALFGLPLGLGIGRIGCFLIHDHPGTLTDFVLGVKYPDGIRHDHGLYLSLNGFILFFFFLYLAKKNVRPGVYVFVFLIWYGTVRFFLDFLRATNGPIVDTRYFGLTPAQYFSGIMFVAGCWMIGKYIKLPKKN